MAAKEAIWLTMPYNGVYTGLREDLLSYLSDFSLTGSAVSGFLIKVLVNQKGFLYWGELLGLGFACFF